MRRAAKKEKRNTLILINLIQGATAATSVTGAARLPPHHFSSDKRFQDRRFMSPWCSQGSSWPSLPEGCISAPRVCSSGQHNLRIFALRYFPQPRRIQFIFQENAFIAIILKELQVSAGCNLQGTSKRGDVGKGKTLGCVLFFLSEVRQ